MPALITGVLCSSNKPVNVNDRKSAPSFCGRFCFMYQRHLTGQQGEQKAADYLLAHGYTILERNWQKKIGEIDIIAQKDQVIYFFEVKTRSGLKYGHPFHAIGRRKRAMIRRLGLGYVTYHRLPYQGLAIGAIGIIHQQVIVLPNIDKF